jgi:hypothetical protein
MPPEHEAQSRVFYDHEQDEPRGRRRRAVADWGVGEDVFDRMPSRRFVRRGEEPRPRRDEDAPAAQVRREEDVRPREDAQAPRGEQGQFARVAPREDEAPQVDDWGGDELYGRPAPVSQTIVIERESEVDEPLEEAPPVSRATTDGRRTIVIGGHPDRLPVPRNRPPRSAVDRIGGRPDRIVAYAVALGVLLILIAILTSH